MIPESQSSRSGYTALEELDNCIQVWSDQQGFYGVCILHKLSLFLFSALGSALNSRDFENRYCNCITEGHG